MSTRKRSSSIGHGRLDIDDRVIPTLREALIDHMTAEQLRELCRLTPDKVPTTKAAMADQILGYFEGARPSLFVFSSLVARQSYLHTNRCSTPSRRRQP